VKIRANEITVGDARELSKDIPEGFINVTITSPPYFDLKDYGSENQIGFGQTYEAYLSDLQAVFKEVHRATVDDGSLWIVIDTFRKDQEVFTLPFDLAARLKAVGWMLRDIIIWKKERTLPWTHSGTTRKIFEYILVLSKNGKSFKYDPDKYRDTSNLKKWWVKYPERYHPKGKSLAEMWSYDIPTQGSWGKEYVRHFCPLPSDLVARIIQITTEPGALVFDPFAGSGTVPTVSCLLQRNYSGIELNKEYVDLFLKYLNKSIRATKRQEEAGSGAMIDFEKKIRDLRIVKYGRLIYRELLRSADIGDVRVFCFRSKKKAVGKHSKYSATYLVLNKNKKEHPIIEAHIKKVVARPPFSKFGIDADIVVASDFSEVSGISLSSTFYAYTYSNSNFFQAFSKLETGWEGKYKLHSPIKLAVEEPDA
jgi:DNA modification methylase